MKKKTKIVRMHVGIHLNLSVLVLNAGLDADMHSFMKRPVAYVNV